MSLYNNKKQEKEFNLHDPVKSTVENCSVLKVYFPDFHNCETSYVLANPTREYNCIGWAIGVKKFIDPTKEINAHYSKKLQYAKLTSTDSSFSAPLYEYTKDAEECMKASKLFFEAYKGSSILPKKDKYIPVDKISHPPQDDTIALYFKEGKDKFEEDGIIRKGFQHAARYVEDVKDWVSDIWSSKLGPQMLITHGEHELEGDTYGNVLCYLVPEETKSQIHVHEDL